MDSELKIRIKAAGLRSMRVFSGVMAGFMVFAIVECGWGRGKPPSQGLDSRQLRLAADLKDETKKYLVETFGTTGFGGKSFCAFKVLDIEQQNEDVNEYVYTVCQEYYLTNGNLTKGTGSGLPVALLLKKDGANYKVISHQVPGDGAQFSRDVDRIFPKRTREEIYSAGLNYKSWQAEVESEAKRHFGR